MKDFDNIKIWITIALAFVASIILTLFGQHEKSEEVDKYIKELRASKQKELEKIEELEKQKEEKIEEERGKFLKDLESLKKEYEKNKSRLPTERRKVMEETFDLLEEKGEEAARHFAEENGWDYVETK